MRRPALILPATLHRLPANRVPARRSRAQNQILQGVRILPRATRRRRPAKRSLARRPRLRVRTRPINQRQRVHPMQLRRRRVTRARKQRPAIAPHNRRLQRLRQRCRRHLLQVARSLLGLHQPQPRRPIRRPRQVPLRRQVLLRQSLRPVLRRAPRPRRRLLKQPWEVRLQVQKSQRQSPAGRCGSILTAASTTKVDAGMAPRKTASS
jgi:hypothetical protein